MVALRETKDTCENDALLFSRKFFSQLLREEKKSFFSPMTFRKRASPSFRIIYWAFGKNLGQLAELPGWEEEMFQNRIFPKIVSRDHLIGLPILQIALTAFRTVLGNLDCSSNSGFLFQVGKR